MAETDAERPVQHLRPLQADAVEDVVEGLNNHDRSRLVMACGTGKTFTSLRIAEQVAPDGGRILFTAPLSRWSRKPGASGSGRRRAS